MSLYKHNFDSIYLSTFPRFFYTCHPINIWLTVSLAVVRYTFVCKHQLHTNMFTLHRARLIILSVSAAVCISLIPNYTLLHTIQPDPSLPCCHRVSLTDFAVSNPTFLSFYALFIGVVRIVPCFLLAIFSILLILHIQKAKHQRRSMMRDSQRSDGKGISDENMTTLMLVAVVSSSFITLSPEGVITLIVSLHKYRPPKQLLNLFDLLIMVNSACNFVLYYTMNRQFRITFKRLLSRDGGSTGGGGYAATTGQSGVFTDYNKSETKHVFHNTPTLTSRC